MLRVLLTAIAVLLVLRWFARLTTPRAAAPAAPAARQGPPPPRPQAPVLSAAERAELEQERERALREGRQIDAIELHRRLKSGDVP
jgi:hypothetical protein